MDKRDFFIVCMQAGKYRDKAWIRRAFSLVRETKTVEDIGTYDIIQSAGGFFFKTPQGALEPIKGVKDGQPMYGVDEPITIPKGAIPGFLADTETLMRRVLYHCIVFVYPFGDKFPFTNGQVNMGKVESTIASRMTDDVEEGGVEDPKYFYPRELVMYYEAASLMRGLAMLFVPAATPATMTIDPKVIKRRDELFNDPNIDMNDPAQAAAVEMELTAMDRETFKNDKASGFLIGKKDFDVVRKKRFISFGGSGSLIPGARPNYVKASLDDGMDVDHFPDYVNDSRVGSYKRGVETMYGGELDKWLVRESSNMRVAFEDCGSRVGMPDTITDFNKQNLIGTSIVAPKGSVLLTEDNIGTYLGKAVYRRSPATCRTKAPDYCNICLGEKLSMNPDALSIAFSQYGHDFMGESMSAMHGKSLTIAEMDLFSEAC